MAGLPKLFVKKGTRFIKKISPGFFVTNMPRILLDLHEIVVFDNAVACGKAGYQ